jgi:adenylyl cyclase-associated protein
VKKEKPVVKKTPRTELMGKKWVIEYHNQGRIELDQVERDHVVYIFQCNDTTIHIKQKVNAVTIGKLMHYYFCSFTNIW